MNNILGIDFGGNFLTIYKKDEGVIFKEPSLLSVKKENDKFVIIAFGNEAQELQKKVVDGILTFSPIIEGEVKSIEYATALLKYALNKIFGAIILQKFVVTISIPCGTNEEEKNDYLEVLRQCGIKKSKTIYSPICVANSQNLNPNDTVLIIDIGAEKTDVAVVKNNEIIKGATLGLGGSIIDNMILKTISAKHNAIFSESIAKNIKEEIGSLIKNDKSSIEVAGVDIDSQVPRNYLIYAGDIYDNIEKVFADITKLAKATICECQPDIIDSLIRNTILVVGSTSLITGAQSYLEKHLQLKCFIPENTENAVILGLAKLL